MATPQPNPVREHGSFRAGDVISAYRIEALVGSGGMGWVYRARHALAGHVAALKVMRDDQLVLERSIDRMMREAAILASVSHPGIPRLHECGLLDGGRPWIAMELVEGEPLSDQLDAHRAGIPAARVIDVLGSVADVLAAAHARGVTHRDLKPDNIILCPRDPAFPVRLLDWGIAHHLSGARFTNMNEAIGTPTYMAPEQARGGPTGGHCDIYGLGVVAYQALVGRAPFLGHTAVEILVQHLNRMPPALGPRCPEAPHGLVELVERMLAKRIDERPTAIELRAEVARLVTETSAPTYLAFELDYGDGVPAQIVEGNETPTTAQFRAPRELVDD